MSSVNDNPSRFMVLDDFKRDEAGGQVSQGYAARHGPRRDGDKRPRLAAPPGNCREESLIRCQEGEKQ